MIKNSHIKKAIFLYKSDHFGQAIEFVKEGVRHSRSAKKN